MSASNASARERARLEALFDRRHRPRPLEERVTRLFLRGLDLCTPPLERAFGRPITPDGSRFMTSDALTTELLQGLFTNRLCGIRVPGFCPPPLAARLRAFILAESGVSDWPVKNLDGTFARSDTQYGVGLPLSEGFSSRENFARYFMEAVPSMHRLRAAAAPDMSPIDRLRLELDERWPHGAHVRHHRGRCMFTGIARVMRPENLIDGLGRTEGICHVDSFPVPSGQEGVFSVNVYLDVPARGGELDIWNVAPSTWDFVSNYSVFKRFGNSFSDESQRVLRGALPAPITIKPEQGDMILINTGRPHAVRGFDQGLRVTLQSFIRYKNRGPLQLMA